jgi:hypothetical protein
MVHRIAKPPCLFNCYMSSAIDLYAPWAPARMRALHPCAAWKRPRVTRLACVMRHLTALTVSKPRTRVCVVAGRAIAVPAGPVAARSRQHQRDTGDHHAGELDQARRAELGSRRAHPPGRCAPHRHRVVRGRRSGATPLAPHLTNAAQSMVFHCFCAIDARGLLSDCAH